MLMVSYVFIERDARYKRWNEAVKRSMHWEQTSTSTDSGKYCTKMHEEIAHHFPYSSRSGVNK